MTIASRDRLREEKRFTSKIAGQVLKALSHPKLTIQNASRLQKAVERGREIVDRLKHEIQDEHADPARLLEAEVLLQIWTAMSITVTNKLHEMRTAPGAITTGEPFWHRMWPKRAGGKFRLR